MTQALNLANFANTLNTSGQTSNSGLQNSSVTVTAGTGMSGGGSVALGSSVTLNNAGVTSIAAGSGISVSASTGGVTITNTRTDLLSPTTGSAPYYAARGWATFSLSGGTLTVYQSYNIASITRTGTGQVSFTFTTAMPDANYAVIGTGARSSNAITLCSPFGNGYGTIIPPTTSGFSVTYLYGTSSGAFTDPEYASVIIYR